MYLKMWKVDLKGSASSNDEVTVWINHLTEKIWSKIPSWKHWTINWAVKNYGIQM